ncbi:MAG: glycosyltransferase family 39 protein [Desulfovibrio sp.]
MKTSSTRSQSVLADWPLWLVLLLAAAIRLSFLDAMELWWDEFVTLGRSLPAIPALLSGLMYQSPSAVSTDCSPPLHHLLVHAALQFGREGAIIRLPSVLFGCLSIASLMGLCKRLYGRRCAFAGGLFCALALFHVYYSRDIRWYGVYYGCSLTALYALYRAVTEDKTWQWGLFSLASAAGLYASYVAAPALAGEGLFVAGVVAGRFARGERREAKRLLVRAFAAFGLTVLLYAPWLPAQYYAYLSFHGNGRTNSFVLSEFMRNMRFFLEYFYQGGFNRLVFALPLAAVGYLFALRREGKTGAWMILAWGLPPIAAAYVVKTDFSVSPKYVMSGFYLLAFGLAFGAEAIARLLEKALAVAKPRLRATAGWGAVLALILTAAAANFHYTTFYQGKTATDKGPLRQVALARNDINAVLYDNEHNFTFVGNWYLGDVFPQASGRFGRAYKRYYLLSVGHLSPAWARPLFKTQSFDVLVGGLVNRAPIPVIPDTAGHFRYADDFRDFTLFHDAFATDNVTADLGGGGLVPADMTRPGTILYAFSLADAPRATGARVSLTADCLKRNVFFPDASATVLAGSDPDHLKPIGRLDALSPPGPPQESASWHGTYTRTASYEIPARDLGGPIVYVAVTVSDGTREGVVKTTDMAIDIDCAGPPPDPTTVLRRQWRTILANLAPDQRPAGGAAVSPGRLAAFSRNTDVFPPDAASGLGGPDARQAFLAAHPGLSPVHVIRDAAGAPVLELYDPWLADPYLHLAGDARTAVSLPAPPLAYKAPGDMQPTLATLDGAPLPLSCGLPSQATAVYARQGQSSIIARELFDVGHFAPGDFYAMRDVRILPDVASLTCMGKKDCQATYRFTAPYPMKRLVVTSFPSVFGDAARRNRCRLSVSANGGPFETVFSLRSQGSGTWENAGNHPFVDAVPLPPGTTDVRVRLGMVTDGSQWQSSPELPMTFEMSLDTAGMPPLPRASGTLVNATPDNRPAALLFCDTPPKTFDDLRPGLTVTPWMRPFFR